MRYYLANTNFIQPRNKLQMAIQGFLSPFDRALFSEKVIEEKKKIILKAITDLNKAYPKCNPEKPYWWTPGVYDDDEYMDWSLGGIDCASLTFRCSQEVKL